MRFSKSFSWACCTLVGAATAAIACNGGSGGEESSADGADAAPGLDVGSAEQSEADGGKSVWGAQNGDWAPDATTSSVGLEAVGCVPDGDTDEPDEDFTDTDCDGIDGDAAHAVFVSPAGSDDANGDVLAPVQTLAEAIERANATSKDVYVCNGDYPENVHIADSGVRLFGGYDCSNGWRRIADQAVVAPPTGIPLIIENAAETVVVERMAFRAASATAPSESSVAATILASTVHLSRVELSAGDGLSGVDGALPEDPQFVAAPNGADAPAITGAGDCIYGSTNCATYIPEGACAQLPLMADAPPTSCADGTVIHGGAGGSAANYAITLFATRWTGAFPGSVGEPAATGSFGLPGANGASGIAGKGFGRVESGRYVAENSGTDGQPGKAGQSGRGGDGAPSSCPYINDFQSQLLIGGGGGQGGYAGCGAPPGHGGGAGGASIALIVDNGIVELTWSRLITGNGGHGGTPSRGITGQPGGRGGDGGASLDAYHAGEPGSAGGKGGDGGHGGPGGGGPSIGIAHVGQAPALTDVSFLLGESGHGALGQDESRGQDGIRTEMYAPEG